MIFSGSGPRSRAGALRLGSLQEVPLSLPPVTPPFHPVVHLPEEAVVLDLGGRRAPEPATPWRIGRYGEERRFLYGEGFEGRTLHLGLDLGGPVGTPVHAFAPGRVLHRGHNHGPGDYGPTLVTEHRYQGRPLFVLLGHLSPASVERWRAGDRFGAGVVLGWMGAAADNGGWPPHVHVQLSWERPATHDLPGVVAPDDDEARRRHPDPALVLGDLVTGRAVVPPPGGPPAPR